MLVSFCYVLLRWLLDLVALQDRSNDFKELEIVSAYHPVGRLVSADIPSWLLMAFNSVKFG